MNHHGTSVLPVAELDVAVTALQERDGGFTLGTGLEPITTGYAVSLRPDREVILSRATEGDLLEYMIRNADLLGHDGNAFGGWCDPTDGRIYLDVSTVVNDRETALRLAVEHDQLAVWDFAACESIPTY